MFKFDKTIMFTSSPFTSCARLKERIWDEAREEIINGSSVKLSLLKGLRKLSNEDLKKFNVNPEVLKAEFNMSFEKEIIEYLFFEINPKI